MSNLRRRRSSRAKSSPSSEADLIYCTPPGEKSKADDAPRSSERIRSRRNTPYNKPSRQVVLDRISSKTSPEKLIDSLKPRHLVNNFTKENHRYNYDPAYTDESSADDFIDDEPSDLDEFSQSESDQSGEDAIVEGDLPEPSTPPPQLHLKTGQNRSRLESDSDSGGEVDVRRNTIIESDSEASGNEQSPHSMRENQQLPASANSELPKTAHIEGTTGNVCNVQEVSNGKPHASKQCVVTDSDISDSEIITPKSKAKPRRRKSSQTKKQVIDSESSEECDGRVVGKKRAYLVSDPSSESECDRLYSSAEEVDEAGNPTRQSSGRAEVLSGRRDYRRSLLAELSSKRKKPSGLT